jgi:hypothetical protein
MEQEFRARRRKKKKPGAIDAPGFSKNLVVIN